MSVDTARQQIDTVQAAERMGRLLEGSQWVTWCRSAPAPSQPCWWCSWPPGWLTLRGGSLETFLSRKYPSWQTLMHERRESTGRRGETVQKVCSSDFYRRPATYLIIASKIVRPSSIYQVECGDPAGDPTLLPIFLMNYYPSSWLACSSRQNPWESKPRFQGNLQSRSANIMRRVKASVV